jgi:hypothetical protein
MRSNKLPKQPNMVLMTDPEMLGVGEVNVELHTQRKLNLVVFGVSLIIFAIIMTVLQFISVDGTQPST